MRRSDHRHEWQIDVQAIHAHHDQYHAPIWAWVALAVAGFFVAGIAAAQLGYSMGGFGLLGAALVVAGRIGLMRVFAKRRARELRAQKDMIHALEQEATTLEIEAARRSGAFDRWEKKS